MSLFVWFAFAFPKRDKKKSDIVDFVKTMIIGIFSFGNMSKVQYGIKSDTWSILKLVKFKCNELHGTVNICSLKQS